MQPKSRVKMREVQFSETLGRLDRNPSSSSIVFALAWLMDKKRGGGIKTKLGRRAVFTVPFTFRVS